MRRLRYQVAASLDGFIAGPQGQIDWIPMDDEIDFGALFAQFDTLVMGRGTYVALVRDGQDDMPGQEIIVFSSTLRPEDYPKARIVAEGAAELMAELKALSGRKDIWLFGGGQLLRSLLDAGLVDTVEVAVVPVLLGGGVPLIALPYGPQALRLTGQKTYGSGIVLLEYEVVRG